eukprot:3813106-Karenia_brevis.AAC.1
MGEVVSTVVKELSCHDCARYVCNDASVHSRCCDSEECCECDLETRPVKPPEEKLDLEVEVDSLGCMNVEDLCCFVRASRK